MLIVTATERIWRREISSRYYLRQFLTDGPVVCLQPAVPRRRTRVGVLANRVVSQPAVSNHLEVLTWAVRLRDRHGSRFGALTR
jgi:hypothetical protein